MHIFLFGLPLENASPHIAAYQGGAPRLRPFLRPAGGGRKAGMDGPIQRGRGTFPLFPPRSAIAQLYNQSGDREEAPRCQSVRAGEMGGVSRFRPYLIPGATRYCRQPDSSAAAAAPGQ